VAIGCYPSKQPATAVLTLIGCDEGLMTQSIALRRHEKVTPVIVRFRIQNNPALLLWNEQSNNIDSCAAGLRSSS
jgi:hypothetical protein